MGFAEWKWKQLDKKLKKENNFTILLEFISKLPDNEAKNALDRIDWDNAVTEVFRWEESKNYSKGRIEATLPIIELIRFNDKRLNKLVFTKDFFDKKEIYIDYNKLMSGGIEFAKPLEIAISTSVFQNDIDTFNHLLQFLDLKNSGMRLLSSRVGEQNNLFFQLASSPNISKDNADAFFNTFIDKLVEQNYYGFYIEEVDKNIKKTKEQLKNEAIEKFKTVSATETLAVACQYGNINVVKSMLENGALISEEALYNSMHQLNFELFDFLTAKCKTQTIDEFNFANRICRMRHADKDFLSSLSQQLCWDVQRAYEAKNYRNHDEDSFEYKCLKEALPEFKNWLAKTINNKIILPGYKEENFKNFIDNFLMQPKLASFVQAKVEAANPSIVTPTELISLIAFNNKKGFIKRLKIADITFTQVEQAEFREKFSQLFKNLFSKSSYDKPNYKVDIPELFDVLSEYGSKTNIFGNNTDVIKLAKELNVDNDYMEALKIKLEKESINKTTKLANSPNKGSLKI